MYGENAISDANLLSVGSVRHAECHRADYQQAEGRGD
jgi:hypothetical protein